MTDSVHDANCIRITRTAPRVAARMSINSTQARPPITKSHLAADWLDEQRLAYDPLLRAVVKAQRTLLLRLLMADDGKEVRLDLEVGAPKEIWMMLLWNENDDYEHCRSQLMSRKTVMLRAAVDPVSDEQLIEVISGPANQHITTVSRESLLSHDRANVAVLSWILERSGLSPQALQATLPRHLTWTGP